MKNKHCQTGMTLIEIMIALLIGVFLLGGVLQIFIGSKQTNRMQEGLSRLQENGRFALDFLARDIRMAGYWGCHSGPTPSIDIAGENDNTANSDSIDNGTDKITLKGAFTLTPTVICSDAANSANSCGVGVNCYTNANSTITYKINNSILQKDTDGVVEGIENMQILYGVDTDLAGTSGYGTPNYYVSADNVTEMAKVVSIRISLLAVTLDNNLTSQSVPYTFNGTTTTPTDRKIRRVFNTTIALRNRLL